MLGEHPHEIARGGRVVTVEAQDERACPDVVELGGLRAEKLRRLEDQRLDLVEVALEMREAARGAESLDGTLGPTQKRRFEGEQRAFPRSDLIVYPVAEL